MPSRTPLPVMNAGRDKTFIADSFLSAWVTLNSAKAWNRVTAMEQEREQLGAVLVPIGQLFFVRNFLAQDFFGARRIFKKDAAEGNVRALGNGLRRLGPGFCDHAGQSDDQQPCEGFHGLKLLSLNSDKSST